ncbi:VOC family protein [Yinghuangia seranimata]|uniref:VOC family protein n=1 Tax=Yinghuangia seranimata TaxID=408067 RepID=UPI00248ADE03|nr:VOC family protein [Yinghuangia seranimata]MDI2128561.1 VOC family protein [Yinghuangia seranimata]
MQQTVAPMISYEDAGAASAWLVEAFGFKETSRVVMPDGRVGHAELESEAGGLVMLAEPTPAYRGPTRHAETCADAAAWLEVPYVIDGVHVYVPDLDAHFARAVAAGATILAEPTETSFGRIYRAADPEGHRWFFEAMPADGEA